MCGRFVQKDLKSLAEAFDAILRHDLPPDALTPHHNIAPTQEVGVIGLTPAGTRSLTRMRWGLVPAWAKDETGGGRLFNARSESAAEKPSFREAYQRRRAIIPADGFYEWPPGAAVRQPWFISRADGRPLAFAALWEIWRGRPEGPLFTCTILTTQANGDIADLHDRMPVLLMDEGACAAWLAPNTAPGGRQALLQPSPAGSLQCWPVGPLVNAVRHDGPELMERAAPAAQPAGLLL